FLRLLQKHEAQLKLNCTVTNVNKNEEGLFEITYEMGGRSFKVFSKSLVIASGGLPISKLGASDFGLRIAKQYGLSIVDTAPALVPLTVTGKDAGWFAGLSGNSIFSEVSNSRISF